MSKSLKILFVPLEGDGHVNACIGLAQVLQESGHKCIFAMNEQWMGRLTKYGVEEVLWPEEGKKAGEDPSKALAEMMKGMGGFKKSSPLEKISSMTKSAVGFIDKMSKRDKDLETILKAIKPDVVMLDQNVTLASVNLSGIPWVLVVSSCGITCFGNNERLPPPCSGLPSNGNQNEWKVFRNVFNSAKKETYSAWNEHLISKGLEPLSSYFYMNDSKYLNIYGYPLELDVLDIRPLPPNWYRFDNLKRTDRQTNFEIPEQLKGKPGKLIYFSLGSFASADVELMKRLIGILGKSKHRFIVSKGPLHSEYSLADNMWGQQSVPQIQVLPIVDLVITHGGNNTVTETFFFGKPLIVLPVMGDQFDNAQRVHEKGFGLRLDPHYVIEEEFLEAIEVVLNDKVLNEKLKKISERIQTENSIGKLPKLIEDLVENNRTK